MRFIRHYILIVDFGSQYTKLLLRSIRELGVYFKLYDWNLGKSQLSQLNFSGIILSGGPCSVSDQNKSFVVPEYIFKLNVPILGICYGMQIIVSQLGGFVQVASDKKEFGCMQVEIISKNILIDGIYDIIHDNGNAVLDVWMSHKDVIINIPKDFIILGITTIYQQIAIIVHERYNWYGVQFHPEVTHTTQGKSILKRFIIDICKCTSSFLWNPTNIIENIISNIQNVVKNDRVLLAFSGGIDSCVTALLLKYAIQNRFICVFVDNGLLCFNEIDKFNNFFRMYRDLNFIYLSEEERFLRALIGIIDPEEKRKVIGKVFIEVFQEQINKLKNVRWLAQGTICSDVVESGVSSVYIDNSIIKSHHNVGGLPSFMNIQLLEPIRNFFKDEVRNIGLSLGLSKEIVYCYPFPGPGIAIRILGEVKKKYCDILRKADFIFFEELKKENLYNKISQAFTVFLPIHSVGVQGDNRIYKWVIALRAIETVDFMTAKWARLPYDFLDKVSSRIVNEVEEVSRVVYDISCKPPATIEWE